MHGDVTVYVARMRVFIEHGFTNRDVYLTEYRFQHVYHHNLLLALYASAAQLTGQSELTTWLHTETWAKLCVAAGHAVLGERLTGRREAGLLLALVTLTLTAAETYALYPNAWSVGYILPMLLALGFAPPVPHAGTVRFVPRPSAWLAALAWVLGQVHVAYAVYGLLLLGPWFGLWALLVLWRPGLGGVRSWARLSPWLALACLVTFAPFALLSVYGPADTQPLPYAAIESAPPEAAVAAPTPATKPRAGVAPFAGPHPNRADDALGGHLETALEPLGDGRLVFMPERIGGWVFLCVGFVGSLLAIVLYKRRRLPLIAALIAALWIACLLFYSPLTTHAAALLRGAFVVARLSTVMCTLLMAAVCAVVVWPLARLRRGRAWAYGGLSVVLTLVAAILPAHAPESFVAHAKRALAPEAERRRNFEKLSLRRDLLRQHLPAGSNVLSTAYFARQVVMLRDCYVVAADRGHTQIEGIEQRRRDLNLMNDAQTPWPVRERLLRFYELRYVVFESRWQQRYAWAYKRGRLLGRAAGLDVVQLDLP
jgi:hypothetical protein